jgi:predicted nucleic acid-binding protein
LAVTPLVDTGFVVALLNRRDTHHQWAVNEAPRHARPWHTCEPVLTEAFHLLGGLGAITLSGFLRRQAMQISFSLAQDYEPVLDLMRKYAEMPISLADACLVRMSEVLADPIVLTTDRHFDIYRRHSRLVIPRAMPH